MPPRRRRPLPRPLRWCSTVPAATLALLAALKGTSARAACELEWLLQPALDATPRTLDLTLRLPAGTRLLRLPALWPAAQPLDDATRALKAASANDPALLRVDATAAAGTPLRWRLAATPGDPALRLEPGWLALLGQAVLPMPERAADAASDPARPPGACVTIEGLPPGSRFVGSAGGGQGERWQWSFAGGAAQAQLAAYAAGALQTLPRQAEGQALAVAVPEGAGFATPPERLADAAAEAAAQQRRFWRDADAPAPLPVLLLPGPAGTAPEGTALGSANATALWLQVPADLGLPDARLAAALTEALLRQRLPERLGPVVQAGRRDEALRAWLAEGLVNFYTHRLLLRSGAWTPEDYAAELNRRIGRYLASPALAADNLRVATGWAADPALAALPAARGEWLMLHWHQALRRAGTPGLDALLRPLMLPAAQARREGPLSAPLGLHRLLAAMRHRLGEQPQRELTQWIDRGQPFAFGPDTLGPCFRMGRVPLAEWRLGFDRASLATGVLRGVEPGGPAAAAGLHDGQRIVGHSVVVGDVQQPVLLQVRADDGSLATVHYTAAGAASGEAPVYGAIPGARDDAACAGWIAGDTAPSGAALLRARAPAAEPEADDDAPAAAPRMKCTPVRAKGKMAGKHGKAGAKAMKCVPVKGAAAAGKPVKGGKAGKGAQSAKGAKGSKAGKAAGKAPAKGGGKSTAKAKARQH